MQAAIWLYPWDLLDGGVRPVLKDIADLGLSAVHLAASYHSVLALLSHNPRRRTYAADRAALYFRPRAGLWQDSPLQPALSPLLDEQGDALAAAGACRDLGLKLVAWTVCLHNTDLGHRYPAVNVINLRGEPYRYSLCAAHPAVHAYLRALIRDLRDRVEAIELEAPNWLPFPHHHHAKLNIPVSGAALLLLTLCFCEHCKAKAASVGADPDRLAGHLAERLDHLLADPPGGNDDEQVRALVDGEPDLGHLLLARQEVITSLIGELIHEAGSTPLYVMPMGPAWLTGADRVPLSAQAARLEVLVYQSPSVVAHAAREALAQVPDPDHLLIGLSVLHPETPDRATCLASVRAAREAGVRHLSFYNYGLASRERLGWIREALRE